MILVTRAAGTIGRLSPADHLLASSLRSPAPGWVGRVTLSRTCGDLAVRRRPRGSGRDSRPGCHRCEEAPVKLMRAVQPGGELCLALSRFCMA